MARKLQRSVASGGLYAVVLLSNDRRCNEAHGVFGWYGRVLERILSRSSLDRSGGYGEIAPVCLVEL